MNFQVRKRLFSQYFYINSVNRLPFMSLLTPFYICSVTIYTLVFFFSFPIAHFSSFVIFYWRVHTLINIITPFLFTFISLVFSDSCNIIVSGFSSIYLFVFQTYRTVLNSFHPGKSPQIDWVFNNEWPDLGRWSNYFIRPFQCSYQSSVTGKNASHIVSLYWPNVAYMSMIWPFVTKED